MARWPSLGTVKANNFLLESGSPDLSRTPWPGAVQEKGCRRAGKCLQSSDKLSATTHPSLWRNMQHSGTKAPRKQGSAPQLSVGSGSPGAGQNTPPFLRHREWAAQPKGRRRVLDQGRV